MKNLSAYFKNTLLKIDFMKTLSQCIDQECAMYKLKYKTKKYNLFKLDLVS